MNLTAFYSVPALAFAFAVFSDQAQGATLVDPGFEGALTFDGPPFVGFWEGAVDSGTSTAAFTTTMPRTGAQSLELNIANPNGFAVAFQDVPNIIGGREYVYSGWHKTGVGNGGVELRIEWRDSVGDVEVSRTPNETPLLTSNYEMFSLTATAPAGADTARVVYAIQSFGATPPLQAFVDDVSFVPEPSTSLLGILGLSALFVRRRQHH